MQIHKINNIYTLPESPNLTTTKPTEDNLCDEGWGVEESVEHVLCNCAATAESRARQGQNEVTIDMMVTHPNVCRKILMTRFGQLRLPSEKRQTPACRTSAAVGWGIIDKWGRPPKKGCHVALGDALVHTLAGCAWSRRRRLQPWKYIWFSAKKCACTGCCFRRPVS